MSPQEVQQLRPGPYVIYFNPNKSEGYGVYREGRIGNRIKEQGLEESSTVIIEKHDCILKASNREIELQVANGYKPNIIPYWKTLVGQITIAKNRKGKPGKQTIPWTYTPEAIRNRIKNAPFKEMGRKTSERQKGKPQPQLHTKEARQKSNEAKKKPVAAYNKDGTLYKIFKSPTDAGIELKVGRGCIYDTLIGRQKTCRGFTWKYVNKKN